MFAAADVRVLCLLLLMTHEPGQRLLLMLSRVCALHQRRLRPTRRGIDLCYHAGRGGRRPNLTLNGPPHLHAPAIARGRVLAAERGRLSHYIYTNTQDQQRAPLSDKALARRAGKTHRLCMQGLIM